MLRMTNREGDRIRKRDSSKDSERFGVKQAMSAGISLAKCASLHVS